MLSREEAFDGGVNNGFGKLPEQVGCNLSEVGGEDNLGIKNVGKVVVDTNMTHIRDSKNSLML